MVSTECVLVGTGHGSDHRSEERDGANWIWSLGFGKGLVVIIWWVRSVACNFMVYA